MIQWAAATLIGTWLRTRPARADLVGDVGVLLAQLAEAIKIVQTGIQTVTQLVSVVKNTYEAADAAKTALQKASSGRFEDILAAANAVTSFARGIVYDLQGVVTTTKYWQGYFADPKTDATPHAVETYRKHEREAGVHLRNQMRAMNSQFELAAKNANASQSRLNDLVRASETDEGVVAQVENGNKIAATIGAAQLTYQRTATEAGLIVATDIVRRQNESELREKRERKFWSGLKENIPNGPREMPNP